MAFVALNSFQSSANQGRQTPSVNGGSPIILTASFGLVTSSEVTITGITYVGISYSVIQNGTTTIASGQVNSSYTAIDLAGNKAYTYALVAFDSQGNSSSIFTVDGGNSGQVYTLGGVTPSSVSTQSNTTGQCQITYSGAYVSTVITYYPQTNGMLPVSGSVMTVANSTSQLYTGLKRNTNYKFSIYTRNDVGTLSPYVTSVYYCNSMPLSVAGGNGGGNGLAYSFDGITWSGLNYTLNTPLGVWVDYSARRDIWLVGGSGGANTLLYSTNGIVWTGLGNTRFSSNASYIKYGDAQNIWVAAGDTSNTLAYSTDGTAWTGLGKIPFTSNGFSVDYDGKSLWVAGGTGGNTIAYSTNGIAWTGLGSSIMTSGVYGLSYGLRQRIWVAAANGGNNTIAYSTNGTVWTGLGAYTFSAARIFGYSLTQNIWVGTGYPLAGNVNYFVYSSNAINWTKTGQGIIYGNGRGAAYNDYLRCWIVTGYSGVGNVMAYSTDAILWTGLGNGYPFSNYAVGILSIPSSSLTPLTPKLSLPTIWVAGGMGTNTLVYSTDAINWTGQTSAIFSTQGWGIAYNATDNIWNAVGSGTDTLAYSVDAVRWYGLGTSVFTTQGYSVAYNAYNNLWVAGGQGTNHTLAYSTNGINWTGNGTAVFSNSGQGVACSDSLWVAGGQGTNHTLAYSTNGVNWTGNGTAVFSNSGQGVACSGYIDYIWVATGQGSMNTLAYSIDGVNWTGIGTATFSNNGQGVAYSNNIWVATGQGTNSLAYSTNAVNWTGSVTGTNMFSTAGTNVAYNTTQNIWVATGQGTIYSLGYSTDGINWTGSSSGTFSVTGTGVSSGQMTTSSVATLSSLTAFLTRPPAMAQRLEWTKTTLAWTGNNYIGVYITSDRVTVPATSLSAPLYVPGDLTQNFTLVCMEPSATYNFNVYPVNFGGFPTSKSVVDIPGQTHLTTVVQTPEAPTITTASFGRVTTPGQISITGITYSASTAYYSILLNQAVIASNQTGTDYTITGLTNNTLYGPFVILPYTAAGVLGPPFTVTGGQNGNIYTLAVVTSAITFDKTTNNITTLTCSGSYSKLLIMYNPDGGSPASNTTITTVNTTSQLFAKLTDNTTYTFTVYAINVNNVVNDAGVTGTVTTVATTYPILSNTTNTMSFSLTNVNNNAPGQYICCNSNGQYVTVVCDLKVYYSSDYGATFGSFSVTTNLFCVTMSSSGQYQYAASTGVPACNIYVSNDYGVTWTLSKSETANNYGRWIQAICCDTTGQYVYTADGGSAGNNNNFYSINYGSTWIKGTGISIGTRSGCTINNTTLTVFAVAGQRQGPKALFKYTFSNNVYSSEITAATLSVAGQWITSNGGNRIYYTLVNGTGYVSYDGGATFTSAGVTPTSISVWYNSAGTRLWGADSKTIYYSIDDGASWKVLYTNFTNIYGINISSDNSKLCLLSQTGGIYIYDISSY
jgi:hypothetical protein